MLKFTNNASATLAGSITASATSVVLTAGNGSLFPALGANEYFFATLVDSSNNLEVIKVTARTTDTLTVVRAQDSTIARAYAAGDKLELRLVAAVFTEMVQRDGSVDFTGQVTVPQGTAAGKAINASRQILTSSNLTGGGNLTADRTLDLSDTGVAAGSFGSASQIPVITVDAKGRITSRSTAALDLSTKVDLNGANATGTWGGTTEWTRVNNRPTALSQFSNDVNGGFFWGINTDGGVTNQFSNSGNWQGYAGNTGNCRPYGNDTVGAAVVVSNCGNVFGIMMGYPYDEGGTFRLRHARWNYNCACNCDCCCCFAPGTLVQMADGTTKPIELVAVGEKVVGFGGDVTVAHKFDTTLKTNSLFKVNSDIVVTGGHLFKTVDGWAALDMSVYPHGVFFRAEQEFADGELVDIHHQNETPEPVRQLRVGDVVNGITIQSVERVDAAQDFNVHNMIVDGGDGFVLASGYAVDGFMRQTCGVRK